MANVDHIKVGSTSYDISPSPTGTLTTGTGGFSSSDVAQASATGWTNVGQITTSDNHASIFTKITQMAKNVRYLYNVLGTGFSTGSTVKGQIDGKAAANHSHKVAQLPTSSTQVNSNDYIPTSALIYSMNQTLTSLNDASFKIKNKIVDIQNSSDNASNNDIVYTFSDGILINVYIMSDSNTNPNYAPFIRIRYDKINNNYTIKIYLIIYSNANGNNFNTKGSTGRIIIYYI